MARPRKPRYVDGVQLVEHLHTDPRGRPGRWRYQRPDGSWKSFAAATVQEANRLAEEANAARDSMPPAVARLRLDRASFPYHVEKHIARRERLDPSLGGKQHWKNTRYALHAFARHFGAVPVHKITRQQIAAWWDTLTNAQQGLRFTELRRLFNELMGEGLMPQLDYNPFTKADDRPRLYRVAAPVVARQRLPLDHFWIVYRQAGEMGYRALQIAMGISLLTTMRRADICALRLDEHAPAELLRRIIGKSEAQRGDLHATRLKWDLAKYQLLAKLVQRAREMSLEHYRCPFVLSHPTQKRRSYDSKEHHYQVLPERLTRMFHEACEATGLYSNLPTGQKPPSFHEVRALSSALFGRAGYSIESIQRLMAHTDEDTTRLYQSGQEMPYEEVTLMLTEEQIGGTF